MTPLLNLLNAELWAHTSETRLLQLRHSVSGGRQSPTHTHDAAIWGLGEAQVPRNLRQCKDVACELAVRLPNLVDIFGDAVFGLLVQGGKDSCSILVDHEIRLALPIDDDFAGLPDAHIPVATEGSFCGDDLEVSEVLLRKPVVVLSCHEKGTNRQGGLGLHLSGLVVLPCLAQSCGFILVHLQECLCNLPLREVLCELPRGDWECKLLVLLHCFGRALAHGIHVELDPGIPSNHEDVHHGWTQVRTTSDCVRLPCCHVFVEILTHTTPPTSNTHRCAQGALVLEHLRCIGDISVEELSRAF